VTAPNSQYTRRVPLAWDERKRLLRITGLAEELLGVAASGHANARTGLDEQVAFLVREVHGVLATSDAATADEFERLVARGPEADVAAELRAAALVGWVKAELATESMEESREEEAASQPEPRRKQTVGFKIRSPITREQEIAQDATSTSPPPH
jgi:hypothetical protein